MVNILNSSLTKPARACNFLFIREKKTLSLISTDAIFQTLGPENKSHSIGQITSFWQVVIWNEIIHCGEASKMFVIPFNL